MNFVTTIPPVKPSKSEESAPPTRRKRTNASEDSGAPAKVEPLKKKNRSTSAPTGSSFAPLLPPLNPVTLPPTGVLFGYQLRPINPPSPEIKR